MQENTIKVACVVCSMATALVISSLDIDSDGYQSGINNSHPVISIKKLNAISNKVNSDDLSSQLCQPDAFKTLNNADGRRAGRTWI